MWFINFCKRNRTTLWATLGAFLLSSFYMWASHLCGWDWTEDEHSFFFLMIAVLFVAMDVDKERNKTNG